MKILNDLLATLLAKRIMRRMEGKSQSSATAGRRQARVRPSIVSRRSDTGRTRPHGNRNTSVVLTCAALVLLVVFVYMPSQSPASTAPAYSVITADPNAVTKTPFAPDRTAIPHGTCPDTDLFMEMYDKMDPNTGQMGTGVVVFDWTKEMRLCIPEWRVFRDLVTNGKAGDDLLSDQAFIDYTGKLAFRGAAALGIPDSDDIARQGLRKAIAAALMAALNAPQPADDPSGTFSHGYIQMPGDTLITSATESFRKEVEEKRAAAGKLPPANANDTFRTSPYTRDVVARQVRENCTAMNAPDVENCVTVITDQFMAKPNNEQNPDTMKGLLATYFSALTPAPTNQPMFIPGDSGYSTFESKVREACNATKHPAACESKTKQAYADNGGDLYKALLIGIPVGNAECAVSIPEIAFADLSGRSDIWNAVGKLQVWRLTNDNQGNTTVLSGVGFSNGTPTVCVDRITGAPTVVAGGTWETRSDNVVSSASQYAAEYAGGGYLTGGIISKTHLYPPDPGGGVYHVSIDVSSGGYGRNVFEIPIAGLFVSPVNGVTQIRPTALPSITPLPPQIQNLVVITSTVGPSPTPTGLTIYELASWASNQGFTMFFLRYRCGSFGETPPNVVFMDDGRFRANVNISGSGGACTYKHNGGYFFAISTDNMSGQSGWSKISNLWVTTK